MLFLMKAEDQNPTSELCGCLVLAAISTGRRNILFSMDLERDVEDEIQEENSVHGS